MKPFLAPCLLISVNMNILLILRIRKLESEGEVEAVSPLFVPCSDYSSAYPSDNPCCFRELRDSLEGNAQVPWPD